MSTSSRHLASNLGPPHAHPAEAGTTEISVTTPFGLYRPSLQSGVLVLLISPFIGSKTSRVKLNAKEPGDRTLDLGEDVIVLPERERIPVLLKKFQHLVQEQRPIVGCSDRSVTTPESGEDLRPPEQARRQRMAERQVAPTIAGLEEGVAAFRQCLRKPKAESLRTAVRGAFRHLPDRLVQLQLLGKRS